MTPLPPQCLVFLSALLPPQRRPSLGTASRLTPTFLHHPLLPLHSLPLKAHPLPLPQHFLPLISPPLVNSASFLSLMPKPSLRVPFTFASILQLRRHFFVVFFQHLSTWFHRSVRYCPSPSAPRKPSHAGGPMPGVTSGHCSRRSRCQGGKYQVSPMKQHKPRTATIPSPIFSTAFLPRHVHPLVLLVSPLLFHPCVLLLSPLFSFSSFTSSPCPLIRWSKKVHFEWSFVNCSLDRLFFF